MAICAPGVSEHHWLPPTIHLYEPISVTEKTIQTETIQYSLHPRCASFTEHKSLMIIEYVSNPTTIRISNYFYTNTMHAERIEMFSEYRIKVCLQTISFREIDGSMLL